ncbi:hypothetical protein [Nonomuraea turcica]|uniref:hypothetical protein n=1 Tax=Nonomuraea sp. G32 TaxID=3067274 RepID=UPI00273CD73B|nr:hypothetical protein [Nonomuraea sp. G32]MDP4501120.1 hypothetical protein [Nonomuraea sp. G32]
MMSDFLIGAIVALSFVLLSLRPLTADTHTWADYQARARRAGWIGCMLGTLRVALATTLLVVVDAFRLCTPAVEMLGRGVPALFRGAVILVGALASALMEAGRPAVGGAA